MRVRLATCLLLGLVVAAVLPAWGQAPRQDVIWARTYAGPITLDGVLDESGWASAESIVVHYAVSAGIPGSGYKNEGGLITPTDPTNATLKLLVVGNQLYLAAEVRDISVGGSADLNRSDGLLMAIKDHGSIAAPKPPEEYGYMWWYPTHLDPQPVGWLPAFINGTSQRWAPYPPGTPRTPEQIEAWDAVTVVHGLSNSDATLDTGYTIEMRINLTPIGYDVTKPEGDVIEWNVSIYDCDYWWPLVPSLLSANRVWWQGPWGNQPWYDEVRIYAKPNVTIYDATVPTVGPDLRIANGANEVTPVIDGLLTDTVWSRIPGFRIKYGDAALRLTYPGVGPYRAGQFQATIDSAQAAVTDPGNALVKMFFKGDYLYFGFDVQDKVVQYHPSFDRWDGFLVLMNDIVQIGSDRNLLGRRLSFQVNQDGTALPGDYLATLISEGSASVVISLNPGTTVDTVGATPDAGYKAEMAIDLKKLGYPAGLGDGTIFLGVNLLDGDSFPNPANSYGTRCWWFREYEGQCCPPWAYLDPNLMVADVGEPVQAEAETAPFLAAHPNPFTQTTMLEYTVPQSSRVTLEIFDVQGRLIEQSRLGVQEAGLRYTLIDSKDKAAGLYLCRITMADPITGEILSTVTGRTVLVK